MKVAHFTGDARESTPDNFSTIGPRGSRLFAKHTQDGIINGIDTESSTQSATNVTCELGSPFRFRTWVTGREGRLAPIGYYFEPKMHGRFTMAWVCRLFVVTSATNSVVPRCGTRALPARVRRVEGDA